MQVDFLGHAESIEIGTEAWHGANIFLRDKAVLVGADIEQEVGAAADADEVHAVKYPGRLANRRLWIFCREKWVERW